MTLIEVLIVVAILSMMSAGIGFAVWEQAAQSKKKMASIHLRELRNVVLAWRNTHSETECPTVGQLVADGVLDEATNAQDPWGRRYRIDCTDGRVRTLSAGPDQRESTEDDISLPEKKPQPVEP